MEPTAFGGGSRADPLYGRHNVMEIIGFLPLILWIGIWIWALVDASSYPDEVWRQAGESKSMWLLLILVLQFFGTLFYFWRVRPKLLAH